MSYTVLDVADVPAEGPGGAVRFVRRRLGATAFGIDQFELGPGADGLEHDESETGQEEVYVVLRGSGVLWVAGEELELRPGRYLRVSPGVVRQPVAGPDGLAWVAIGAFPPAWWRSASRGSTSRNPAHVGTFGFVRHRLGATALGLSHVDCPARSEPSTTRPSRGRMRSIFAAPAAGR